MKNIIKHNSTTSSYKKEVNFFADLTEQEFQSQFLSTSIEADRLNMEKKLILKKLKYIDFECVWRPV